MANGKTVTIKGLQAPLRDVFGEALMQPGTPPRPWTVGRIIADICGLHPVRAGLDAILMQRLALRFVDAEEVGDTITLVADEFRRVKNACDPSQNNQPRVAAMIAPVWLVLEAAENTPGE